MDCIVFFLGFCLQDRLPIWRCYLLGDIFLLSLVELVDEQLAGLNLGSISLKAALFGGDMS